MWLKSKFVTEVEEVARIGYIGSDLTKTWNQNKKPMNYTRSPASTG